jgi:hypothetical protein
MAGAEELSRFCAAKRHPQIMQKVGVNEFSVPKRYAA